MLLPFEYVYSGTPANGETYLPLIRTVPDASKYVYCLTHAKVKFLKFIKFLKFQKFMFQSATRKELNMVLTYFN